MRFPNGYTLRHPPTLVNSTASTRIPSRAVWRWCGWERCGAHEAPDIFRLIVAPMLHRHKRTTATSFCHRGRSMYRCRHRIHRGVTFGEDSACRADATRGVHQPGSRDPQGSGERDQCTVGVG